MKPTSYYSRRASAWMLAGVACLTLAAMAGLWSLWMAFDREWLLCGLAACQAYIALLLAANCHDASARWGMLEHKAFREECRNLRKPSKAHRDLTGE